MPVARPIRRKVKPNTSQHPCTDKAIEWASGVLEGSRPICNYTRKSLERHFLDMEKVNDDDFPYYFDPKRAEKRIKILQELPHTKGKWGMKQELIILEPWQCFGIAMVFGWVRKKNDKRRFREAYFEVPRKNGKSIIAAGVGHAMFIGDNEYGSEIYCGARTEKQAWEVFKPAKIMMERTPALARAAGVQVNAKTMTVPSQGSIFAPIIGKPGDGASPSCAIIDEYHEHDTNDLYDTMSTGMGAREQPLIFIITTAGYNTEGPCFAKRRECIEMLNGIVQNEELFAYIWTIDDTGDWTDPNVLIKANPNYGVSVFEDYLLQQQQKAINSARAAVTFKTKHLNVWTASKVGFFNMVNWQKAEDKTLKIGDFAGETSILGFDLARKLDLNSMSRLFTRMIDGKRHYYSVSPQFWCPHDTIYDIDNKRSAECLQAWLSQGFIIETDGAEVDYRYILSSATEAHELNPTIACPIDPYGATGLQHAMEDEGMLPVVINQGYANMSDPMKELEAAIESGRFHHDGNPIMTFGIGNVVGKHMPGNDDVVRPVKEFADNKIDGAVALIMAVGIAIQNLEADADPSDFLTNPLSM